MHVLLVKTSSLGDVVHNLPVVTDIQRHLPGAVIDWVVEEGFADIPRLHPGVHKVIPVALRRWRKQLFAADTWREIAALRYELKHDCYDVVLDTQGLIKSAVIAKQAGLAVNGRRVGYAAEAAREPLAAHFYDAGFAVPKNAHAIERNRRLAASALGYALDQPLDYGINTEALVAAKVGTKVGNWLPPQPYAVFLTGTSRTDKLWPEADWLALARALDIHVVLPAGSAEERARAQRLAALMPRATMAPALNVAGIASLMGGAHFVVGLDTGLTHLAAALNRSTLAIFCGSAPQLTGILAGSASGNIAINLGDKGAPPSADEVISAVRGLR